MREDVISYREICDREGFQTLQRGMNFRAASDHSIVLMSQRTNAPYDDAILPDGKTIEYEGHDAARTAHCPTPKDVDQPKSLPSGKLTQNGLFAQAVRDFKLGKRPAERVRVYEKLFAGVWSDKGLFELVDFKIKKSGKRSVFRFFLRSVDEQYESGAPIPSDLPVTRMIPSEVKKQVWKRDGGRCTFPGCGKRDHLHFDHDIPYSKGGSSLTAANIRLLCARHNIQKHDKIE